MDCCIFRVRSSLCTVNQPTFHGALAQSSRMKTQQLLSRAYVSLDRQPLRDMFHLQRWELRDITSLVIPIALTLYRASAAGQGQAALAVAGFGAALLADSSGESWDISCSCVCGRHTHLQRSKLLYLSASKSGYLRRLHAL